MGGQTSSLVLLVEPASWPNYAAFFVSERAGRTCQKYQVRVQKSSNFAKFLQLSGGVRQFRASVWCGEFDEQQSSRAIHRRRACREKREASNRRLDRGRAFPRETPGCVREQRGVRRAYLLCFRSSQGREEWGISCERCALQRAKAASDAASKRKPASELFAR